MMSTGHVFSALPVGYTAATGFSLLTGIELHWIVPHIAAVVCAGWALWPDCDTLKSTVSTSLGIITRGLHELVTVLCAAIYYATRTDKDPADKPVIHRGATHTWPGALVMGLLVAGICAIWPRWGTPAVLGISLHWAMRGLYMPKAIDKPVSQAKLKRQGRGLKGFIKRLGVRLYHRTGQRLKRLATSVIRVLPLPGKYLRATGRSGTLGICLGASIYTTEHAPVMHTYWSGALGAAAVLGILTHMAGDSVTESGVCWRFPFVHPKTGRRWQPSKIPTVTVPDWVPLLKGKVLKPAFKTGRAFEIGVVYPLCIAAAILAAPGGYALAMDVISVAWRGGVNAAVAIPWLAWPKTRATLRPS